MLVHIAVVYVLGNIRIELTADLICLLIEDDNIDGHVVLKQELADRINGNSECLVFRIAIDTGRDERKCNCLTFVFPCQSKRSLIAGDEFISFTMLAVPPAGPTAWITYLQGRR